MDGRELMAAAIYFAIEILYLVEALHSLGILHADIKPDNFLLQVSFYYNSDLKELRWLLKSP